MRVYSLRASLSLVCVLSLAPAVAAEPQRHAPPPDSISKTATMPAPSDSVGADTSMWRGSGLNTTGGSIIRHTPQGSFLKRLGSRTWEAVGGSPSDTQPWEREGRESAWSGPVLRTSDHDRIAPLMG